MAKAEKNAIDSLNKAILNAEKAGIYVGAVTLHKSKNNWSFFGNPMVVKVLQDNTKTLIYDLEKAARNTFDHGQFVPFGDSRYGTKTLLPAMPTHLEVLPLIVTRSYVSHGLQLLSGHHDCRTLYNQPQPAWWPEKIPFSKPSEVPSSFTAKFGKGSSAEWHKSLKQIIYLMHRETRQDFRKNVDERAWSTFLQK